MRKIVDHPLAKTLCNFIGRAFPSRPYLATTSFASIALMPPLLVLLADPSKLDDFQGMGSVGAIWIYSVVVGFALHWVTPLPARLLEGERPWIGTLAIALTSAALICALTMLLFPLLSVMCPYVADAELSILGRGLAVGMSYVAVARFMEGLRLRKDKALLEQEHRKALLAEERFRSLQAQMHPHFLFNALNTIAEQIHSSPESAEEAVEDLSELLRSHLRHATSKIVSLREEIDVAERYLSLQRARFGERLRFDLQVEPNVLHLQVPALILQPLLENAVKHGVALRQQATDIILRVSEVGDQLHIDVSNDMSQGKEKPRGTGFGLRATRERLQSLFAGSVVNLRKEDDRFFVNIVCPAVKEGDKVLASPAFKPSDVPLLVGAAK